jgi:hypothetical protein
MVINDYNLIMGAADQTDELRWTNPNSRRVRKGTWRALFNYLFNTVFVNNWLLASIQSRRKKQTQIEFRTELLNSIFKAGTELLNTLPVQRKPYFYRPNIGRIASLEGHKWDIIKLLRKCEWCLSNTMEHRVEAVVKAHGWYTKY